MPLGIEESGQLVLLQEQLAAVQQSEERFRRLANSISQLAWIADASGSTFWYNQRWLDYTGATQESMQGWGWLRTLHPDHVERVVTTLALAYQTGQTWEDIFPICSKSGEYRWFLSRAEPVNNDEGKVAWWFGTNTDITEQRNAELQLKQSQREYAAAFEQAPVGISHLSLPKLHFMRNNRTFIQMLGYSTEELAQLTPDDVTHPADIPLCHQMHRELLSGERPWFRMEKRMLRKGGEIIRVRETSSPVRNNDGSIQWIITLSEDITTAWETEGRLHKTQERLQLATEISQLGFWEWDVTTGETYFSPELKRQLGYGDDGFENLYEEFINHLHPEDREKIEEEINRFIAKPWPNYSAEFRMRHEDGSYRWIWAKAVPHYDQQGKVVHLVSTHLDVTERKQTEEKMRHMAQHDALTGLANRTLIYELAPQYIAYAKRNEQKMAVLFFDLDRFKPINDTYGHQVGDRMLQEVANRLKNSVREEDVVGRIGGDEFVALLTGIRNQKDIGRAAMQLLENLRKPYVIGDVQLDTSPSIGISLYPNDGKTIDELIRNADAAMYHAKESGRNRFEFFSEKIQSNMQQTLTTEQRMRHGLNHGEFELLYQPIIKTSDGQLAAVEALLRWNQPFPQNMGPAQFIPIAETSGLINSLGDWVIQEACRQHEAWKEEGLPAIRIAINVSAVQFRSKDFIDRLTAMIFESGIDPSFLEIELTESTVMKQMDETFQQLRRLKEIGVNLSLDDFGTGYSSLSYLSMLPIDKIKIDRSFIHDVEHNRRSLAIAETVITLGKKIGVEVVAEGIETNDALEILRDRECDLGQGFELSRPLAASEIAKWFKNHVTLH
ncbi:EAL domain-containing protein [Oxalobacteraceae bacterium R-40]|uniref:EAL domain-containing protein n=1 Tax=Keguizhuia sedimenti TaxID=3064264 RepID=A0ABU1BNF1_9BURK|nr:EAL domain-containing protein [Oxalobacteraceae bacterium R-40]